jgi:hypothetical protein
VTTATTDEKGVGAGVRSTVSDIWQRSSHIRVGYIPANPYIPLSGIRSGRYAHRRTPQGPAIRIYPTPGKYLRSRVRSGCRNPSGVYCLILPWGIDKTTSRHRATPRSAHPSTARGTSARLLGELADRGTPGDMVATMAHLPSVLGGYLDLNRHTKRAKLNRRIGELISIAEQTRLRCSRCLKTHEAARPAPSPRVTARPLSRAPGSAPRPPAAPPAPRGQRPAPPGPRAAGA